ncbi:hypothetical protein H6F90_03315 [Trichocoleus sp. FACHB-591]|nr:hypothetical protein [Trichocoleus sp. FACHB-591]MBD2094178.1 hypothetical protein [Trichocoleus sp. FACHB-591]
MIVKANVSFYLYTGDRFLDEAGNFLNLPSEPAIVEEARDIRSQNEVQQSESLNSQLHPLSAQDELQNQQILEQARQNYHRIQQITAEIMQSAFDPRDRLRAQEMLLQAEQQLQKASIHIREVLLQAEQKLKDSSRKF